MRPTIGADHTADVKKEAYKGVELSAAPGLWRVKLGPNKYERVIDDRLAEVFARRTFILYTDDANLRLVPSQLSLPEGGTGNFDFSEVVICSDGRPIIAYKLQGELVLSSYAMRENKVFVFLIDDNYSKEGAEINKKYNILYDSLFTSLQRTLLKDKKAHLTNAQLSIYESWDFFDSLISDQVKERVTTVGLNVRTDPINRIIIDSLGVYLLGDWLTTIHLTKEDAPQLWAVHEAMKRIESLDPNYLATVPADKVLSLL